MVDVSEKDVTLREAAAAGRIEIGRECAELIGYGKIPKGDVLAAARIAGIMGVKKTSELIPLCHSLNITKAEVSLDLDTENGSVSAVCTVRTVGRTGAEMEALTGVSTALLTIYDMCKSVSKKMRIGDIRLIKKSGGRSGLWEERN